MGIDYSRCSIRPGADRQRLNSLIKQQSVAFQSVSRWQGLSQACSDFDDVEGWLMEQLHSETYTIASKALRELLILPEWDEVQGCATDIPDLSPCMHVYPITHNPIIPPLWRMQAYRTILPDQLSAQLSEWKEWTAQVAAGQHTDYVRRLHMFHDSDFARYHWGYLRGQACWYSDKVGDAHFREIRQKILLLPEPAVWPVPVDPNTRAWYESDAVDATKDEQAHSKMLTEIRTLVELTIAWNRHFKEECRVPEYGYEGDYYSSLETFKKSTIENGWFQEFLQWTERCIEHGFGFYLEY